jgi:hypothetical protein
MILLGTTEYIAIWMKHVVRQIKIMWDTARAVVMGENEGYFEMVRNKVIYKLFSGNNEDTKIWSKRMYTVCDTTWLNNTVTFMQLGHNA